MQKVLLVEDTEEIFNLINPYVSPDVELNWVTHLHRGIDALQKSEYDLVLLDIGLPDGDGLELLSWLVAQYKEDAPEVILLTGKDSVADKVLGFSLGADDYIAKPFNPIELKARIESRLRKKRTKGKVEDIMKWEGLEIHRLQQKVLIGDPDSRSEIYLTSTEFRLLVSMASQPLRVFSRDELLDAVWGESLHVYPRSVDTHISKLRKKLESMNHVIESVHGSGYRFNPPEKRQPELKKGIPS